MTVPQVSPLDAVIYKVVNVCYLVVISANNLYGIP